MASRRSTRMTSAGEWRLSSDLLIRQMTHARGAIARLLDWAATAPPGTMVPVASLRELLEPAGDEVAVDATPGVSAPSPTWRERLWTVPPDTRIGVSELSEGLGRSKSWVYRHTSNKSKVAKLPHRKLDGQLVFVVGEARDWIKQHEELAPVSRVFRIPHRGQ